MKYKQKLKMVEAFQYTGDFNKLSEWFIKESTHSTLPFFWSGRELHSLDQGPITPGTYLILSADRKRITTMSKEEFEACHSVAPYKPLKEEK